MPVCVIHKNSSIQSPSLREQSTGVNAKLSLFLWEMFPLSTGNATHRAVMLHAYTPWVCCSSAWMPYLSDKDRCQVPTVVVGSLSSMLV